MPARALLVTLSIHRPESAAFRVQRAARLLVALSTAVAGCRDSTAPIRPSDGPLEVSLTVEPASIFPGASSVVTATADLPDSQTLDRFELAVGGLVPDTALDLPILGPGPHTYVVGIAVPHGPIEGELRFRARARVGTVSDSADGLLVVRDDGPPRLELMAPPIVEPPDSLTISLRAQDAAGISEVAIRVDGAVTRDTIIRSDYFPTVDWTFATLIPRTARLGDSVVVQATARDGFNKSSSGERIIRIADTTQPMMTLGIDTVHHAGVDESFFPLTFFPGDTVRMRLAASDNHSLTWLGYRILQFGDSTPARAASDSARFEFVIPAGTNTPNAYIDVFAGDSSQNRSVQRLYAVVMDGTFRPIEALSPYDHPLIEYDQQGDYALDSKRDVLYFTTLETQIHVLSLRPLAERPAMEFGASVRGVDLSPGGDSLVAVVLGRPNLLLVWDLARGPSNADTIPLTLLGDCDAWDMQVAANGRALVTGWSPSGCPTVEVDLRTRAQRLRNVPAALRNLVRSGDQSAIVAWDQFQAIVYHSETDSLAPARTLFTSPTVELEHAGPSVDQAGTAILIRNRLYRSDLSSYSWIQPDPGYFPPAHALSASGQTAFLGSWPGYLEGGCGDGRRWRARHPSAVSLADDRAPGR